MVNSSNTLEMIYQKLDLIKSDEYGCHICPGRPDWKGYVRMKLNGKEPRVHRIALERKLGRPIRPGYFALHTCDTPACVNPNHLYEGTKAENNRDRMLRNPESFEPLRWSAQIVREAWKYRDNPQFLTEVLEFLKRGPRK
jgi:hypothetical protein